MRHVASHFATNERYSPGRKTGSGRAYAGGMPASPGSSDPLDTVDAAAAAASFSGVISVQRPGQPLVERAYGLADRRWQVPNSPDTIFALASVAKTFTALAVMSLVADGLLAGIPPRDRYCATTSRSSPTMSP